MTTYAALRADRRDSDATWWNAASRRRDAPRAIAALVGGRSRVEVTRDEGQRALAWAAEISGWPTAERKPVYLHEPA
jgi:hypothetical protein